MFTCMFALSIKLEKALKKFRKAGAFYVVGKLTNQPVILSESSQQSLTVFLFNKLNY